MSAVLDVVDVEARVISVDAEDRIAEKLEATSAPQVTLVPTLVVASEVAKINPAILLAQQLVARVEAALPTLTCDTKEGEAQVRALHRECVKQRTGTESAYKAWNRPILDAQKEIRGIVKQVEDTVTPAEEKLHALIQARELAIEAEKQRAIEAEQARIAAVRARIGAIGQLVVDAVSRNSAEIDVVIGQLQEMVITDAEISFAEFSDEASAVRASTVSRLLEMFRAKREAEDERVRLNEERRAQQERERLAEEERGLRLRITAIQARAFSAMGKPATQIKDILAELTSLEPLALEFGALYAEASAIWASARTTLQTMLDAQQKLEDQQAEQARIEREQAAERKRLEQIEQQRLAAEKADAEAKHDAMLAELSKTLELPVVSTKPQPVDVSDEFRLTAADAPFQVPAGPAAEALLELACGAECTKDAEQPAPGAELYEPTFEAPAPLVVDNAIFPSLSDAAEAELAQFTMSQFACRADLEEARALFLAAKLTDDQTAGEVADQIVDALDFADFPTEAAGELTIVSLLLHPEIQAALRARQAELINAIESAA